MTIDVRGELFEELSVYHIDTDYMDIEEALYTMSELNMWPDGVDSVSPEQALLCWKLVEYLTMNRFPEKYRM